jgi:two-component system sensor histidine kinase DegS
MNANKFLTPEFLNTARQVKRTLLEGGVLEQPYEQRLIRKNGSTGILKMATSLVKARGEVVGFQHIARDVTEEMQLNENMRYLLRQVTGAQEEERKRIARELHDDTIQSLVVHHHQLWDLVGNIEKLPLEIISQRLQESCRQNNNIIGELRRLSQDLRPAALDRFGLMPTLGHLASDLEEKVGIRTKINIVGAEKRLPSEVELVLFRIVQEALRNIWKHAVATSAEITMDFGETETRVTVKDNGKGFNVQPVTDNLRHGKLGLAGMQERASLLGGTLKVESAAGKGTTLTAVLPAYISYP